MLFGAGAVEGDGLSGWRFLCCDKLFLGLDPGEFQERCQTVEFLQDEDGRRISMNLSFICGN